MYGTFLYPNIIHPLYHHLKRDAVNRAMKDLERNQWLSGAEVQRRQERKLAALLGFAAAQVPYYREVLGAAATGDSTSFDRQLRRIPPLTKDLIRTNLDRLVAGDRAGNRLFSESTSGSTGEPLRFFIDQRSIAYRQADKARGIQMTGLCFGARRVKLWGSPLDESSAEKLRGRVHARVTNYRFLSAYEMTAAKMDNYTHVIERFRPQLLESYPSALDTFARHCGERGVKFDCFRAIVTSAETLYPHQRELFEHQFKAPVFNRYGSREFADMAHECQEHSGLHVSSDRFLIEILDDSGQPCEPGQPGEILVTDLENYGMPMIRYRIGDRAAWSEQENCGCGRGLPLLARVEGRSMDVVKGPNGNTLAGTFWFLLFRTRPGISQFQVVQDRLDGVSVAFVRDKGFKPSSLAFFREKVQDKLGDRFDVDFREVPSIGVSDTGKRRPVICSLEQALGDVNVK